MYKGEKKKVGEEKMRGEVHYLNGRIRRLPDIWSENEILEAEAGRQAINSPVQGLVSDMALLTMALGEYGGHGFKPIVDENFFWMGQLHDEVIFRVRKGFENEKCKAVKDLAENLPTQKLFGFTFSLPVISELKIGPVWSEAKEWQS